MKRYSTNKKQGSRKFLMLACVVVFSVFGFVQVKRQQQQESSELKPFIAHTLYGDFQVTEPVLIELFTCPAMERIKHVRQYGMLDYIVKQPKEYTRYEHCVGVWALLRKYGASLEEQIAGLLHDASHTVFSHGGDYLYRQNTAKSSYQDDIHEWYLTQQKIDQLLVKHNLTLDAVLHKSGAHTMLEQDLPDICIDRLEYNLQGGLQTSMLSVDQIAPILDDTRYEDGRWFFVTKESAKKLGMISLFNTEHVWGSSVSFITQHWLADALRRALEIGLLTSDDIHFSTDMAVWDKLWISNDPLISQSLDKIVNYKSIMVVTPVNEGQMVAKSKFRGLNPWVKVDGQCVRLVDLDSEYKQEYERVKKYVTEGWGVTLKPLHDEFVPCPQLVVA